MIRAVLMTVLISGVALAETKLGADTGSADALKEGFEALLLSVIIAAPAVAIAAGVALLRFDKEAKTYFQNELRQADEAYADFLEKECVSVKYNDESLALLEEIEELEKQLRRLS